MMRKARECGIGYSTESAMLLSSSPSACSGTVGMLAGAPCTAGGEGAAVGGGPMMGMMYGSLGRSLGQTWGQYTSLSRPPPPTYDPEAGTRFHTLSSGSPCTRRPSESFV
ncbi:hypothetical protein E2C01_011636 [Portunus trituberculatus]|uniref:Uncharacterized protein n=1 Tax=Portunus trituberculatus TaxID=210409 RepID=A0A5B7DBN0_PORTR|nr:hypothetical protein [Portunus trituberculatus]